MYFKSSERKVEKYIILKIEYKSYLKKLKIELPCDPAIPLLGICPEKTIIRKDTCTPMFIAALFTIASTWKQPVSIDRGMDKEDVVHIYNRILFSHKKEWNNAICISMDGPRDSHTEWSKSDREGQISYCLYVESKKKVTNELIYKTEIESQM